MGTSNAYGGPKGGTPLVPSWLEPDGISPPAAGSPDNTIQPDQTPPNAIPSAQQTKAIPQPLLADRFIAARNNFSRFARSGGSDRASLGRAISHYVSTSSGGARQAAQRMGSARGAGARLFGFLSDVQGRGAREALRALNLEGLAGQPIEKIFIGLIDYVCPEGGSIDEGIARDAFIETIADLASLGVTDLDTLSADQMHTVFELYATHAIENRLCNDVGTKAVILPDNIQSVERVQAQLRDFIRRGVSDALNAAQSTVEPLTPERVLGFVSEVYETAFSILQMLGETEEAA